MKEREEDECFEEVVERVNEGKKIEKEEKDEYNI